MEGIIGIIMEYLPSIMQLIISIVVAIVGYLITKYLGVIVEEKKIEKILTYLLGLIIDIEETQNEVTVKSVMECSDLSKKEEKVLKHNYGTIENAVLCLLHECKKEK